MLIVCKQQNTKNCIIKLKKNLILAAILDELWIMLNITTMANFGIYSLLSWVVDDELMEKYTLHWIEETLMFPTLATILQVIWNHKNIEITSRQISIANDGLKIKSVIGNATFLLKWWFSSHHKHFGGNLSQNTLMSRSQEIESVIIVWSLPCCNFAKYVMNIFTHMSL